MLVWAEVTSALRHASPVLSAAQGSPHRSALEEALLSRVSDTTALRYLATIRQLISFLHDMSLDAASLQLLCWLMLSMPCVLTHAQGFMPPTP